MNKEAFRDVVAVTVQANSFKNVVAETTNILNNVVKNATGMLNRTVQNALSNLTLSYYKVVKISMFCLFIIGTTNNLLSQPIAINNANWNDFATFQYPFTPTGDYYLEEDIGSPISSVSTLVGHFINSNSSSFKGTFDGKGYKIFLTYK